VAAPELVPVPASVFDDDFFRVPRPGMTEAPAEVEVQRSSPVSFSTARDVQQNNEVVNRESWNVPPQQVVPEAVVRATPFGAPPVAEPDQAGPDELDIPAFLRRST
jgi:cell division protein FtsZ